MAYQSKYTGLQIDDILDSVEWKEGKIEDLEQIRAGAQKGATALQSYTEKYTGTVTGIKINGETKSGSGVIDLGTISTDISGKVDKVAGKQLSTEDFTTALKTKLEGLNNYDDTELSNAVETLRGDFDEIVSGDTTTAIKTFNEVIAFLDGLTDTQDLDSIIASIEQQIAGKMDTLISGTNIKTINGESILGSGDLTIESGAKVYTWNWDGSAAGTLTQEEYDGIIGADIVYIVVMGGLPTQVTMGKDGDYRSIIFSQFAPQESGDILVVSVVIEINEDKSYNSNTNFAVIPTKTSQLENDSNFVSSTNIKTINGESILGSGNITISGGGTSGGSGAYAEVNHGTSDTTFTLTPNTFHIWDEVANLTLTLGSETSGVANEFLFQFTSGATATSLTLPDDIKWANDSAPTIAENMIYQVSILKGLASVLEFNAISSVMPITLNVTRWAITESSVNPKAAKLYKELMDISQGTGNGTLDPGMLNLYIVTSSGQYLWTETVTSFSKSTVASVPGILLWHYDFYDHILQEDGTIAVYDWD